MQALLRNALNRAVQAAKAPGAVACIGDASTVFAVEAAGERQTTPSHSPATPDTPYDLASLTKVVATTTALMMLWEEGRLDLDASVGSLMPVPAFNRFTVRHLLTHTTGLSAMQPWYRDASSLTEMVQRAALLDLAWPPGTRRQYSDIGFMILGRLVELVAGDSLDAYCRKRLWQPLGMTRTDFRPPPEWAPLCAATEDCAWRKRVIVGEVHDENASAAGGVSGHAGLFSTAPDLAKYCQALLSGRILKPATLTMMTRVGQLPFYPWQGLGWKVDPWGEGSEGYLPARSAFGHTGWTGTSIWMDRETRLFAVLLSNTCHPSRQRRDNRALRRAFYSAIAQHFYIARTNTHGGLDRLLWDVYRPLAGARTAVLTNNAAINEAGLRIREALQLHSEMMLRRIYSPEHGYDGAAEAGAAVVSQQGALPITSLYGTRRRPTAEELRETDFFVIDLPDVGARYYTYAHTMKDCLRACAESGTPVLVLDRPNPLGGAVLEGPVAQHGDSPVCWGAVPVRHGMTLGEIALFFQNTELKGAKLDLRVNRLDNWPRDYMFHQCSLPWAAPSPNIPRPDTALLYVGMCLFEGTNLNEGRGTESPFHLVGAPWLDPLRVLAELTPEETEGCLLRPTFYTPRSLPGRAVDPRFRDQLCRGIHVSVVDAPRVRAFTTSLAILRAIRRQHPEQFAWNPFFDTLAGGPGLREQVDADTPALDIVKGYAAAHAAYDKLRPRLY
ncbi:MAG: DUF1343 domain-containing protein [Candidatus Hydrogenedentes bacterium]|nr:DUF1343 domain-containing protein [Candidatus Hydrogenedentota bacterium]